MPSAPCPPSRARATVVTELVKFAMGRPSLESPWLSQKPVREELFSVERLEEHARSLAVAQTVTPKPTKGHPLSGRLANNGAVLLRAYRAIAHSTSEGRAITPAAEWLVDNYYLVEREIREIRAALPPGYYRQLPKLLDGPFAGYPRVFGVAWAFVAHTDSHFDAEMLCRFVHAYQEVQPLTIGELWAVAITLRIVLIENLRRLAELIMHSSAERQEANALADRLLGAGGHVAEPALGVLAGREGTTLPEAFAVQLVHRLRDQDPRITPALTWLDQHLAAQGSNTDTVVHDEHQRQGSGVVTVRNIITSMRMIADVDWPELFERICLVDDMLAAGSAFRDMDFSTRNLYRSAIEDLSRGSNRTELDVTRAAVEAAKQAPCTPAGIDAERRRDPGYHLLAGGRREFEAAIGFRPPPNAWPGRLSRALGIRGYVGAGILVAAVFLAMALFVLYTQGLGPVWLCLLGLLGVVPAVDAAVAIVNRCLTRGFGARPLPALELRSGVPKHLRTLIAVPTMLTTTAAIEEQIERLEVHHLASPEGELHFALLSDWLDATEQQVDGDAALLEAAFAGIAMLNQRYGAAPGGARFLLLHRRRLWNAGEERWIGWERKRGKLHELNRLLRGATDTSFLAIGGLSPKVPSGVRYVVTLDADTRLPRDAVRRLIGKMAHPLNRPMLDSVSGRVVAGHAVLQPRVTPSLPVGRQGSLFQRIFSSMSGIDPYAAAASDVYQDLIGEGSYAGKGIYEIDAFEAALADRVPDSTLLSHDLFEGIFARAGLTSDVEVVEEFPARYDVAARRHHRWARGDWQLLPWLLVAPFECPGDGPLEDAGQSAADIVRTGVHVVLAGRIGVAVRCRIGVVGLRSGDGAAAGTYSGSHCPFPATPRDNAAQPSGRRGHRSAHCTDPMGTRRHIPRAPGVADGRCDSTDPDAAVPYATASPGMGSGGASVGRSPTDHPRLLSRDGRCRRLWSPGLGSRSVVGAWHLAFGGTTRRAVDRIAGDRALGQPLPPGSRQSASRTGRWSRTAANRAADLALLRDLCHGSRQHAAAGQFPGGPGAGAGSPDVTDESRIVSTVRGDRARTLAGWELPKRLIGWRRHWPPWEASRDSAAISTTGTARAICARSIRPTSRQWIAATWPAI